MPFPLTVAGRAVTSPPMLASLVLDDAKAGGGTLVAGQPPSRWLMDLVRAGALEERLAAELANARLSSMIGAALEGHDVGVLLHPDPMVPGHSVEDALLRSWATVAPLADATVRGPLLERLRNAGITDVEVRVIGQHG